MAYSGNLIPTMTSATAPSGVASASGNYNATYAEWKAFNHMNAVYADSWLNPAAAGQVGWLQYQFPTASIVTGYAVTSQNDVASYQPKTWTFKGSNNGTTWVTLGTQTNVTDWAATPNVRKVFGFANATAYAYYRLDITASNDGVHIGVGELEMMTGAADASAVPLMTDHYSRMRRG